MENELSIKISASVERALKSLDRLIPKINETDNCVSKMLMHLDKNGEITGFTTELKKLDSEMDRVTKNSKNLKNALNLGTIFSTASKAFRTGYSWMQNSIDYSESLNLFNVVLDKSIDKGMRFQNVMNEAFGTNQAETLTRQGLYQSMAENMGIAQEYAYIMSETSAKLVNDLSSLYNKSETTVANALSSGIYSGQVRPMRSFGIDLTEKSLQPILEELDLRNSDGSARTVRDLSQAEKQILRYIAVLKQSGKAHGDWANTIEAPANQLKILSNQAIEASRAFSNLFVGAFGKILPYANAILMVIKEVSNAIATMFGIEISDYNTGIADMGDAFIDVEDDVDGASNAIKELKKQTLGFDQINNITENKDNGSGIGSSLTGGIDQKLLDSITSYDNGMESVRMKATQIRDQIMKWLGFTKKIDPLTGKVSFKYAGIKTTLKNIWDSFKGLSTTGKILVGLGLFTGATKLYNIGKKIFELLGGNGLVATAKNLLSPFKGLVDYTKLYVELAGGSGLTGVKKFTEGIKDGTIAWGNHLTAVDRLKLGLIGGGGLLISLGYMKDAMDDIANNGTDWANTLQVVGSGLGSIASGASLGTAILPGWGTLIGGIAGGIAGLVTGMTEFDTAMNTNLRTIENTKKEVDNLYQDWQESQENILNAINNSDSEALYHKNLFNELTNIVDENGKIKQGYEDRAKTITTILSDALGIEIDIVDGQIQKYDDLKNKINEVIEKKKAQVRLATLEQEATEAITKRDEEEAKLRKTILERDEAEKNLYDQIEKLYHMQGVTTQDLVGYVKGEESLAEMCERLNLDYGTMYSHLQHINLQTKMQKDALNEATNNYNTARDTLIGYNKTIYDWEKATEYVVNENYDALNFFFEHERNILGKSDEEQKKYWDTIKKENKTNLEELEKNRDKYGEELYNKLKIQYTNQINLADTEMEKLKLLMDTKNGKISDSTINKWKEIGESSKEQFLSYLKLLPSDLQTQVVDKMKEKGFKVSEELQKGLDQIKPSVDVKVNGPSNSSLDSIISNIKNKFNGALGGVLLSPTQLKINGYADGGIPPIGQMFIAREKGPELVGSIGRKTAVMNNNQIVDSVKAGVYEAVSMALTNNTSSTNVDINVHAEEGIIVEKAVRGIQQHVNKTGELPFTVPM